MKFILLKIETPYGKYAKPCAEAFEFEGFWTIELNNLEELVAFSRKNGSLIIKAPENSDPAPRLSFLWD